MAVQSDPRDRLPPPGDFEQPPVPPPNRPAPPPDLRDHMPPFLRRYCPDQEQCRRWAAKCGSVLHDWLTRFGKACVRGWKALDRTNRPCLAYAARRWQQLDRKRRIWTVCALVAVLLLPLLLIFDGHGTAPAVLRSESSNLRGDEAAKNGDLSARQTGGASLRNETVPNDWVRFVNRGTGHVIGNWRIEPAGEFYKLKDQSGHYVAIAEWAKTGDEGVSRPRNLAMLHAVADSSYPYMLWKIEPLGNGFWTIMNSKSKKCLMAPKESPAHVVRQSAFREGAMEEEWRLETVSPPAIAGENPESVKPTGEARPARETPVARPSITTPLPRVPSTPSGGSSPWPWPFKQTEKEVGVQYKERVIPIPDAETRELNFYTQEIVPGATLLPDGTSLQQEYIIYDKHTEQGKLIAVSQDSVCVLTAGRKNPSWILKAMLRDTTNDYVKAFEIELATKMGEYAPPRNKEAVTKP